MKSLRAKIFVSIGVVFLFVAILSYTLPAFFVHRDLRRAAAYITKEVNAAQTKAQQLVTFWISYRVIERATQLEGLSELLSTFKSKALTKNAELLAAQVLLYDPQIAFVQVTDEQQAIMLSSEGATLYTPHLISSTQESLTVQIANQEYVATPTASSTLTGLTYQLRSQGTTQTPFVQQTLKPPSLSETPDQVYQDLLMQDRQVIKKAQMIQELARLRSQDVKPDGILVVDGKLSYALLTQEAFHDEAVVNVKQLDTALPFVLFRHATEEVVYADLVRKIALPTKELAIGFSISSTAQEIAAILQKPLLLVWNQMALGFTEEGEAMGLSASQTLFQEIGGQTTPIQWEGEVYYPSQIQLDSLALVVLTPESEVQLLPNFLLKLRSTLSTKISFNLLGTALLGFIIALLLLGKISGKISRPIVLLARASEEVGRGKYENLTLPVLGQRHDEIATLTTSFEKMMCSLQEREKIRSVLNKVVSKEVAEEILKSSIELGGEERVVTMLFSDIRSFTPFSETLSPKELIGLLNDYMTQMCEIIDQTHGVVDKFVGDEIIALYGAPLALENHPDQALEAARLMMQHLKAWNVGRAHPIEIGIGVHTGLVCTGNMGAQNRLNYTVIGAHVNLTARLCSAAAPMQVLVTAETVKLLTHPEKFHFQSVPPLSLKGIDHPVEIYMLAEN